MVGKNIRQIKDVEFGVVSELKDVDFSLYRTCRGNTSIEQIKNIFELVMNESANEDLRDDAINDGLWDLLVHQYTLYSATPLALDFLLRNTTPEARAKIDDVQRFVKICTSQGDEGIFLTSEEIEKNKRGMLPIYSIKDILDAHA